MNYNAKNDNVVLLLYVSPGRRSTEGHSALLGESG